MKAKYIFTPGPVKMSDDILAIGGMQTPYFRNAEFSAVLLECERNLIEIANAPQGSRVIFLTSSGTGAMESAVANLLGPDDAALVINGGSFAQRFVDICSVHNIKFTNYRIHNDNLSDTSMLPVPRGTTALLANGHETSIGVLYDLEAIGKFCRQNNLLNIVDAISMFITDEVDMNRQNIDALIISSHKGLAVQPGLGMVILSPRAIERLNDSPHKLYFDFNLYLKDGARGQTPFTPAVTVVLQLQKRLQNIMNEGLSAHREKARDAALYFRQGISGLPLKIYSRFPPNAMTALSPTDGKKAHMIVSDLERLYDVVLTPNGGDYKDTIFRISHMGNMTRSYVDILINALKDYYHYGR